MKRILMAALAVAAVSAQAQDGQSRGKNKTVAPPSGESSFVHVIPIAGASVMGLTAEGEDMPKDTGASGGILLDLGSEYFTFETGLLYNQFGAKQTEDQITLTILLDYVSIPVAAKFNLLGDVENTIYLKAGVMPGFAVKKKARASFGNQTREGNIDAVKDSDIPVIAGVGGAISIADSASFVLEANYIRSLSTIAKTDVDVRNEGFSILGGVSIGL